jgi:hypothetical protein
VNDLEAAILRSFRGGLCVACDAPADQVDHFKPRHAGGPYIPENLLPLCALCNKTKSCMWPGHGYHPFKWHDNPLAATAILIRELDYLTAVYGESRLLEVLGEELEELSVLRLEHRGEQRDANRARYLHLAEALYAELGDRAYEAWYRGGRGWHLHHPWGC